MYCEMQNMNLQKRINLLLNIKQYMLGNDDQWQRAKQKAFSENNWFTPEFIELSLNNIAKQLLNKDVLTGLANDYKIEELRLIPKNIGIVMPGNIPLEGIRDIVYVFLTGHYALIKPSIKDSALIKQLIKHIHEIEPASAPFFTIAELLKKCDAYIATNSNDNPDSFIHYFSRYPNIIRKKHTSVAILDGSETTAELEQLSDDIHQYFGLSLKNVTKIYVPLGYDFIPLLNSFNKYESFTNHNKYKNNYDYHLAMHILNNKYYMTNGSTLLIEEKSIFSPVGQVHYEFYDSTTLLDDLKSNKAIFSIIGHNGVPFGKAQFPVTDVHTEEVDTINFLKRLNEVN